MAEQADSSILGGSKAIVIGLVMVAGGVGVVVFGHDKMREINWGTMAVQLDDVAAADDPSPFFNRRVTFARGEVLETNLQAVRGNRREADFRYVLIKVKDSYLLASVPLGPVPEQVAGYFAVWSAGLSSVDREAIEKVRKEHPKLKLLPFQFDGVGTQVQTGQTLLGTAAGLLILGTIYCGVGGVQWLTIRKRPSETFDVPVSPTAPWATTSPKARRNQ